MLLRTATITRFRSIVGPLTLHLEPNTTAVLGANDHGKTNLLLAIARLNPDSPLEADDVNWDFEDGEEPTIQYELELEDADRSALADRITEHNERRAALLDTEEEDEEDDDEKEEGATAAAKTASTVVSTTVDEDDSLRELTSDDEIEFDTSKLTRLTIDRIGVGTQLRCRELEPLPEEISKLFLYYHLPRIEIIESRGSVEDAITLKELNEDTNEFMKGILYYAGIAPSEAKGLFTQTDRTSMRLTLASEALNDTLKKNWTQGKELEFRLQSNSKNQSIELRIKDPAVRSRYVRASSRSSGFTHYFAIKTALHARESEHKANRYIWLFDEPGSYLHPAGQHDMLQVLDQLGERNQVAYVTHSPFMINRTFPTRHRLVRKTESGTHIIGKPYTGHWSRTFDALGMSVGSSALFAPFLIIGEGDTEAILLPALIQKLVARGDVSIDLNAVAFVGAGTAPNAEAIARIFSSTEPSPTIAVLVDGDDGGRKRNKHMDKLIKHGAVVSKTLTKGTTIEDHCIAVEHLYVAAAASYFAKLDDAEVTPIERKLRAEFKVKFEEGKVTAGVAKWVDEQAKATFGEPVSKIGVAREYVDLLTDADEIEGKDLERAKSFAKWMLEDLGVPSREDSADDRVLQD